MILKRVRPTFKATCRVAGKILPTFGQASRIMIEISLATTSLRFAMLQDFLFRLLNPALIWILIPITWLLLTTVVEILKLVQKHRERMALINQGIHPDLEPDEREAVASELHDAVEHVTRETAEYVR